MLHLRVQGCGLHPQQSRCLRLITTTMIERALDQLDLVSLDLVVKVDAIIIKVDLFAAVIGGQLGFQAFNLAGQGFGEQR